MSFFNSPDNNIKAKIFNQLDLSSLLNTRLVSRNWSNFFNSDHMELIIKDKVLAILNDISICETITLLELQELVNEYLREDDFRMDFFIVLKKLEDKIIRTTANAGLNQRPHLTITLEEIQPYIHDQFGISGLFHSNTLEYIFGRHRIENVAKHIACLFALEKVLQANSDPDALAFVNCLIKNKIIKLKHGYEFQFVNNQLYLANKSDKISLAEIYRVIFPAQYKSQELVNKEVKAIMEYLKNDSTNSVTQKRP